jgi:hypothetical protein
MINTKYGQQTKSKRYVLASSTSSAANSDHHPHHQKVSCPPLIDCLCCVSIQEETQRDVSMMMMMMDHWYQCCCCCYNCWTDSPGQVKRCDVASSDSTLWYICSTCRVVVVVIILLTHNVILDITEHIGQCTKVVPLPTLSLEVWLDMWGEDAFAATISMPSSFSAASSLRTLLSRKKGVVATMPAARSDGSNSRSGTPLSRKQGTSR